MNGQEDAPQSIGTLVAAQAREQANHYSDQKRQELRTRGMTMINQAQESKPLSDSLGWGSCLFNGLAMPELYWGARTIFHPSSVEYERQGYKRNRNGQIVPEYKGGPPVSKIKEICHKAWLDFLPDRRGWAGSLYEQQGLDILQKREEFINFRKWLDKDAMPQLKKWIQGQEASSSQVLEIAQKHENRTYHLRASPCASYGYCYLAAWSELIL